MRLKVTVLTLKLSTTTIRRSRIQALITLNLPLPRLLLR